MSLALGYNGWYVMLCEKLDQGKRTKKRENKSRLH